MSRTQQPGFVDAARQSLAGSAVVGALAFVANYVLVYVFLTLDGIDGSATDIPVWKLAGYVFFNAQNVGAKITQGGQSNTINYLESAQSSGNLTSTVPKLVYYIVPAIILIGAGYFAYQRVNRQLDGNSAAGVGASIVGGYVVLCVVGAFVFKYTQSAFNTTSSVAPKLSTAIILAGIVYPVVLGAVGGYAAAN